MILRFLVVVVVAMAWAVWRLNDFALPVPVAVEAPAVSTNASVLEQVATVPIGGTDGFLALTERPLFRSDRRPFMPEPVVVAAPAPEPVAIARPEPTPEPAWVLIGIGENSEGRVALLRLPGRSDLVRAREGDVIEGREVVTLSSNEIRLRDLTAGDERNLRLPERISD